MFKTPLCNRPSVIYIFTGLKKVTGLAYFLPLGRVSLGLLQRGVIKVYDAVIRSTDVLIFTNVYSMYLLYFSKFVRDTDKRKNIENVM